ncbi:MAG: response regulator [Archangium sp.]|nr:response regulator [Archangium sp.]
MTGTQSQVVILGIDEDRAQQTAVAQAFNEQGLFYRFITDRRKVSGGLKQLRPHLIIVFGELESDFAIQVLDTLASDVTYAQRPVLIICNDTNDSAFVQGLRTGVVGLLQGPFTAEHVPIVRSMWEELSSRNGTSAGTANAATLQRYFEHIRRTRRSGIFLTNPRTPNEGKASFVYGRLDKASFLGAQGADALKAMSGLPQARWTFTEMAGSQSEGAGVVIEVGDTVTGETPVAEVIVGEQIEDEPLAFEVASGPNPPPSAPVPAVPANGPQAKLLLVDDDPAILKMFSTLFAKHGFVVTTATDGNEGAAATLQQTFDAVLADLNMPHLDGWGMLRVIRDDFRTRELPISFLSAHDDYRESLRALDAGAQAYLSKGTKLDVIVGQVVKLLEPRRAMQAAFELGQTDALVIHQVGPQWLLRLIGSMGLTGTLICRDGWASYQLFFNQGACFHASAVAGKYNAEGERAFNAFIASRAGEGSFSNGVPAGASQNLHLTTEVLIERACTTLNDNERRMRESLMLTATQIDVNAQLYEVYRAVGPKQWLEAARLICEEKTPPRDLIAQLDISPVEIEECMKDLIRRGVVSLRKA